MSRRRALSLVPSRRRPLLLDAGGWLRALQGEDAFAEALADAAPAIVPAPVLPEMDWHLRKHRREAQRLLREIGEGRYEYVEAVRRILTIDRDFAAIRVGARYRDAFELAVPLPVEARSDPR
jgi:hypothetical protein